MLNVQEIKLEENLFWNELIKESNTATFFQTKEWFTIWTKHFGGEVNILAVFEAEKLIGIAPFEKKEDKINFLGLSPVLGNQLVSDFGDIIATSGREQEVWETIIMNNPITQLSNNPIKFELNFIREESPSFKILKELGGKAEEMEVSPVINLPKTWDEYLSTLDRHDRHEIRRKMRKGNEAGLRVVEFTGQNEEIDIFFKLMGESNEQKKNSLTAEMKNFFRDIINNLFAQKMLQLTFLKLDDTPISCTVTFLFADEVLLYNSGFAHDFIHLSPGLILTANLIKRSIENGKKKFDFLRGGERYKYDLGGKERKLYKIRYE